MAHPLAPKTWGKTKWYLPPTTFRGLSSCSRLDNPARLTSDAKLQRYLRGRHTSADGEIFVELSVDATAVTKQFAKSAAVSITSDTRTLAFVTNVGSS